ncbi:hypothetical protein CDSM653_00725 [Caldanaerobacter subterraneus subsp. pacificus DSM 12653]|uniref:Uncharacterized protein n=1 Tax=Caldanaerobacter subterraneus subsp. pacificus DSM 12653 TaxID=391606 RepID=A0A0F5PPC7_9THEO|nr:hypothetical protein CDSM653_00725 [Caldanaerobacter subterraneus subsp. pacificus DSM 12653]
MAKSIEFNKIEKFLTDLDTKRKQFIFSQKVRI